MWYREGTITFTQGSNTLVGAGTAWNVTANGVLPGMIVVGPDNKLYEIKRVTSDTNIVLSEPYTGETQSEVPCRIITTYEGDLTQFSARFTALMSRMSADSKSMRSWLTAVDEITIEREDGTELTIKSLTQIVNEHNKNVEWYKNNTDEIDSAGTYAREAASSATTAAQNAERVEQIAQNIANSISTAQQAATDAANSAGAAKTSETNAAASQQSAATSASTATTKASEAASLARDASASKEAAKSSEANAKASETSAESSKTAAASSASSAASSASSASASKDEATKQASAAKDSAMTASSKATEATGSATAASQSKTAAESAATRAEAAAARAEEIAGAVAMEDASLTTKGVVKLSSATNSTSESLAATPKAVKAAYDLADGKYTAQDATTTQKGIIQLSSAINDESETLAATPKAVKVAYDNAENRLQKDQNGADIPDKNAFRESLGLGDAATKNIGTTAGTVAAGNDSRLVNALQKSTSALAVDLNTLGSLEVQGTYYQPADKGATAAHHYPVLRSGTLQVLPGVWGGCQQEYTSWNPPRKFVRTLTGYFKGNGPWSPWVEVAFTDSTVAVATAATKLQTTRRVGGVDFDGTSDISLPGVDAPGDQDTTGNAATATKLQTPVNINGTAFDGSHDITIRDEGAFQKPALFIHSSVDLNTLGGPGSEGFYFQKYGSVATVDHHYPTNRPGTLTVLRGGFDGCQQEYFSVNPPRKFFRALTGAWNGQDGPWSDWFEIQTLGGGSGGTQVFGTEYQNKSSERGPGVTYTNSRSYPIMVIIDGYYGGGDGFHLFINDEILISPSTSSGQNDDQFQFTFIVPAGATYMIFEKTFGTNFRIHTWLEFC